MRHKRALVILVIALLAGLGTPAAGADTPFVTRPAAELLGTHIGYGYAGAGVATATGNFVHGVTDLTFSVGLLRWSRTYNSLDDTTASFGRGWSSAFSARLLPQSDGSVRFRDDDGRVLTFLPLGGGAYQRPPDLTADLSQPAGGGYALRYLSGEVWSFDSAGRGTGRSRDGESLSFGYDDQERLTAVTHSAGYRLDLTYDGGRISKATAGDGRAVSYDYSGDGALAAATGPAGPVERYTTAPSGQLATVTDADGRTRVSNAYDAAGRVSHQDFGAGGAVDLGYDADAGVTRMTVTSTGDQLTYQHDHAGRLVTLTDPAGNSTRQSFDDNGRLTAASTAGGVSVQFGYDAHGNVASSSVGGVTTRYVRDAQDRLTSVTDPGGGVTEYGYTGDSRLPSTVTDPTGAVSTYSVTDGLVTAMIDSTGAKTSYDYDGGRRLLAVTDPAGSTTRYRYDAAGHRTTVTSPLDHTATYQYDPVGRVVRKTDPSGASTAYSYSAAGQLLSTTDPTGATRRNEYNAAGRLVSTTDPVGRTTTYTYDGDGNLATMTNPAGGVSRYTYDPFGRVSTATAPAGTVVRYGYDADGRQTERTQPVGTTVTSYDARGKVAATTDAAGRTTRYEYDANGRVVAVIDPTGAVWRTTYDAAGRVIAETNPLGAVTRDSYDAAGRLRTVTDPLGHTTTYSYDAAGRLVKVVNPIGGVTIYTYDAEGNRTSDTTPAGLVTRYEHDANGRLVKTTDPRGGVTSFTYNARGQQVSATSPGGAVRRVEYDAASQLIRSIDPNGHVTGYSYDAGGNLAALTEPSGAVTRYAYDTAGRQTSSTDPLGRVTKQIYDGLGNLTSVTDPAGKTLRMEYNPVGELLKRTGADGATISFSYDAAGRRASMVDGTGTSRYGYDAAGQLTSYTEPDGSMFALGYDAAGRRVSLRYPDNHTIGYQYDDANRLVGLSGTKAGDASYRLDPDGRVLAEQLPGGWTRNYDYTAGVLTRYREARGSATTQDTTLIRDADARITRQLGPSQDVAFGYDKAGAMVTVTGQPGGAVAMAYDANGNRTGITRAGLQSMLSYDRADQLVATDTGPKHVTYSYDQSGRLLTRVGRDTALDVTYDTLALGYDSFGRRTTRTRTKGGTSRTEHTTYNGDGLPTQVVLDRPPGSPPPQTLTKRFQWSVGDAAPQILTQDGAVDFVYGYGRVLADTAAGSAVFSHDVYGSTVRTAETTDWAQAPSYDAFGDPQGADDPMVAVPSFGYRGELADDDSVYLRARDYDSTVGRFTARDPVAAMVGQTDPNSPYAYANNDPVNMVDPTGDFALGESIGQLLGLLLAIPAYAPWDCEDLGDPGNSTERHDKCFQGGGPLRTRGYIPRSCLDADLTCLNMLWNTHQPERAAQAFTINELNKRRENWWDRFQDDQLSMGTEVSKDVDWEVGDSRTDADIGFFGFRIDIVTDETNIFEVKRFEGDSTTSEVTAQLNGYVFTAQTWYGITFSLGTELQDWANAFTVYSNGFKRFFDVLGDEVYVWGLENPPGHVYFAMEDKTPSNVRAAAEIKKSQQEEEGRCGWCIPVPPIIRVPVPA